MRYIIIASIITAILGITAYILDFTNNKTDKFFLMVVGVLLIITGLFFTIRGEVFKEKESKVQTNSIFKTKKNTELIIQNINDNLERLSVINDSVVKLSSALSSVEYDLDKQLKIFKNTLSKTEIFEQKVSEQLKLEKKRFEAERPMLEVVVSLEKAIEAPGSYRIVLDFRNLGKRTANEFKCKALVGVVRDKKNITEHIELESLQEKLDISSFNKGKVSTKIKNSNPIDISGIEKDFRLIVLLKYTYKDDFLNKTFNENNYYFWFGFNKTGLLLTLGDNKDFVKKFDEYISKNNLEL